MQPSPASYTFDIDAERQVIRIVCAGTWRVDHADRYGAEFRRNVTIARERFGRVRALVDARTCVTTEREVGKRLASFRHLLDQPDDRFAVVTCSSLRKQQANRDGLPDEGMAFLSKEAAETWLFAHD